MSSDQDKKKATEAIKAAAALMGKKGGAARSKSLSKEELALTAKRGGDARAKVLTKAELTAIGKKAAAARWGEKKQKAGATASKKRTKTKND